MRRATWIALLVSAGMLVPYVIDHAMHYRPTPPHDGEASWAIQGEDDALRGCPGRYHQYATLPNGGQVLIGCWGDGQ